MLKLVKDQELIDRLVSTDNEFRSLYEKHIEYEQDLEALYSLKYFPPEVEIKIKEIKVIKLRGKDRMLQIISKHKNK